jgi:tripartite-type tricarboxylate transporter receptor subunit TctC
MSGRATQPAAMALEEVSMKFFAAVAVALATGLGTSGVVTAQDYPARQITIVVPFAAGNQSDGLARMIGNAWSKRLGQPVVILNKPGATGMLGTEYVSKLPADGYTIQIGTNSTHAANKFFFKSMPYDMEKDFVPIGIVGPAPYVLVVNKSLPVNSVGDLVEYAKANPGKLAFPFTNSVGRISGRLFGVLAKTEVVEIPYTTNSQALAELIDGQTQYMFTDTATALPFITAGRVKALAVTPTRNAKLPGLPAMTEVFPDFQVDNWTGFFVRAGTPPAIIARLNQDLNAILATPGIPAQVDALGYDLLPPLSPQEWSKYVANQVVQYGKVVKTTRIEPQ